MEKYIICQDCKKEIKEGQLSIEVNESYKKVKGNFSVQTGGEYIHVDCLFTISCSW